MCNDDFARHRVTLLFAIESSLSCLGQYEIQRERIIMTIVARKHKKCNDDFAVPSVTLLFETEFSCSYLGQDEKQIRENQNF